MDIELVIQLTLANLPLPDPKIISKVSCLNRECNKIAKDYMSSVNLLKYIHTLGKGRKVHQTNLRTKSKCALCNAVLTDLNNPLSPVNPCCVLCTRQNFIFTTEAHQVYRLTLNELSKLDSLITYHRTYRTELRQYSLPIVKAVSYIKHKGLPPAFIRHKESPTRKHRFAQFTEMLKKLIPPDGQDEVINWKVSKAFLKNGAGGVRKMRNILAAYKPLKEAIDAIVATASLHPTSPLEYLVDYVDAPEATLERIRAHIANEINKVKHKNELEAALANYGLALRSDSSVCAKYIREGGDLDTTVKLMRQMDYFFRKTDYPAVYGELIEEAYHDAKHEIYETYGWIENAWYYEELLEERINRHQISRQAKEIVVTSLNDLPDFMIPLVNIN